MKTLAMLALGLTLAAPAQAWTPLDSKKLCDTTTSAFSMLRQGQYQPVITSRLQSMLVTVWLNPARELIVSTTASVQGQTESLTCIVTMGEAGSFVDGDAVKELSQ
jgi:hypothetical protein